MRSRGWIPILHFVSVVAVGAGSAELSVQWHPSRPLDGNEANEMLVDESEVLLIARVTRVDSTTVPVPGFPDFRRRKCNLEPVEWLRGGLDGDQLEVFVADGASSDRAHFKSWASLAGVDSLGVLIRLQRVGTDWIVVPWTDGLAEYGYRVLPQRSFKAVRDSILHARERVGIDSLVARADLIIVVADSTHIVKKAKLDRGLVRVERLLKGGEQAAQISIQPWRQYQCAAGEVVFLKRIGPEIYEPLPFHTSTSPEFNDWDAAWERQPFATETAVRRALERVSSMRAEKPEER